MSLSEIIENLKSKSEQRFDNFSIEAISSISRIKDDAYLKSPTWLGGDNEFVCLFVDLDDSSKMSFKKQARTMAQVYDYFTQNIVDVMSIDRFAADYIDIKGDGAFGIYEGRTAAFKALCAALTFKTLFDKEIRSKFEHDGKNLNCKLAIHKDKLLVRKIGKQGDHNNEVWAGRLVNNASKLASLNKKIQATDLASYGQIMSYLVISEKIYKELEPKKDFTLTSCGHDINGNPTGKGKLWTSIDCSQNEDVYGDVAYYYSARWCKHCGDNVMAQMLV